MTGMDRESFLARTTAPDHGPVLAATHNSTTKKGFRTFLTPAAEQRETLCRAAKDEKLEVYWLPGALLDVTATHKGMPDRRGLNIGKLKVLWVDIDVKPAEYPDVETAIQDLGKLQQHGYDLPHIVVNSGGGLHAYWVLTQALMADDWQPLANALAWASHRVGARWDTGIVTDRARVMRMPDTFNWKQPDNPRRVEILHDDGGSVDPGSLPSSHYGPGGTGQPRSPAAVTSAGRPRGPVNLVAVGGRRVDVAPAFREHVAELVEADAALGEGLFRPPPAIEDVAEVCEQFRLNAAERGANENRMSWLATINLIASTSDGYFDFSEAVAFAHPEYTHAEVVKEWKGCQEKKALGSLPPPLCERWRVVRPEVCGRCEGRARGLGNSPITIAQRRDETDPARSQGLAEPPPAPPAVTGPVDVALESRFFPPEFGQDDHGVYRKGDSDLGIAGGKRPRLRVCDSRVVSVKIDFDDREQGGFIWTMRLLQSDRRTVPFTFTTKEINGTDREFMTHADRQNVSFATPERAKLYMHMARSWTDLLRHRQAGLSTVAGNEFGWADGGDTAFGIAGRLYRSDGTVVDRPTRDPELSRTYTPVGKMEPWRDALAYMLDHGAPELVLPVAAAFAAPLLRFTGQAGVMLSLWSPESGCGKTASFQVAQAVWGHPTRAMNSVSDTTNSVLHRMGMTPGLPSFWDEARFGHDVQKFADLMLTLTQGKERSRLDSNAKLKTTRTWETIIAAAGNRALGPMIARSLDDTAAGALRLFEVEVGPSRKPVALGAAQAVMGRLGHHYGAAGAAYAAWLAVHADEARAAVVAQARTFEHEFMFRQDERFWLALISALWAGLTFAQTVTGHVFNFEELNRLLTTAVEANRQRVGRVRIALDQRYDPVRTIADFMHENQEHWYTSPWFSADDPRAIKHKTPVKANLNRNPMVLVHVAPREGLIRIARAALAEFVNRHKLSLDKILVDLARRIPVVQVQAPMGPHGLGVGAPMVQVVELDVKGPDGYALRCVYDPNTPVGKIRRQPLP